MSTVSRLPADKCVYAVAGRCVAEATDDPALYSVWRCHVLLRWDRAFEDYLEKIDRFELTAHTASRIWARRMEGLLDAAECDAWEPGEDEVVGCAVLYNDLCLLNLPACDGRCTRYSETPV